MGHHKAEADAEYVPLFKVKALQGKGTKAKTGLAGRKTRRRQARRPKDQAEGYNTHPVNSPADRPGDDRVRRPKGRAGYNATAAGCNATAGGSKPPFIDALPTRRPETRRRQGIPRALSTRRPTDQAKTGRADRKVVCGVNATAGGNNAPSMLSSSPGPA